MQKGILLKKRARQQLRHALYKGNNTEEYLKTCTAYVLPRLFCI